MISAAEASGVPLDMAALTQAHMGAAGYTNPWMVGVADSAEEIMENTLV